MSTQLAFQALHPGPQPFSRGLLKWIGNKQRFAHQIAAFFPREFGTYFEVFLGSGAVLGTLAPARAVASDSFGPLLEIWQTLSADPELLKLWYAERWLLMRSGAKLEQYEKIKAAYNAKPNAADLLFLCRACYGGVVRFRKADGWMSTPCGIHSPIHPKSFAGRVDEWHRRTAGTRFVCLDYREAISNANRGDFVYCDPPYRDSQGILYGAQGFDLNELFRAIEQARSRGVRVALSIDGTKKSGGLAVAVPIPPGLFEHEILVNCGRSMLRRFQLAGRTLEGEVVSDRLLLTYRPED